MMLEAIIISGEGSTFSSGHDLKELRTARNNSDKGKDFFKKDNGEMFKNDAINN